MIGPSYIKVKIIKKYQFQVIIHAKESPDEGIVRFNFTDHLRNQLEFGPIFNKKFLKQVLKLQQQIEDLQFKYTESDGVEHKYSLNKG